jgi:heptosyltransferase-2
VSTIRPYDVLLAVRLALENEEPDPPERRYRRILVARSDRIGDVLISTPVLKALRDHYPSSFIAMMVAASNRELVEGNPYLDQVILLDKDGEHRGLWGTLALSRRIRRSRFDVAVILHPTVRVHLICFLAGIRERIGYDRKAPFLLTQALAHRKQEGLKHEMEYNADLLRPLGIVGLPRQLTLPANPAADLKVDELLRRKGVGGRDILVALSPTSSGPPRNWPAAKFAALAERLNLIPGVKVCVVAHADHRALTQQVIKLAQAPVLDLTGAFTLSELGCFFKRCRLVISNISGPAHLSVAVGTPVISIFGGNQPGLSPVRWRPLGPRDVAVHHKTDCPVCHAHNCARGFACLEAVTVDEVLGHAERMLGLKARESR